MQGVYGKKCCDNRALPYCTSHLPQYLKQQEHRDRMQDNIGSMMAAGVQTVKLTVQHVRQSR